MHSLVLGGNGFIGVHLARRLLELGPVRVFDLRTDQVKQTLTQVEAAQGEFEQADFPSLLEGIDVVYHLISTTIPFDGTNNSSNELTGNVLPTIRLLDAMAARRGRIIFVSSAGTVYGETETLADEGHVTDPICSYGIGKLCIEKYLSLYQHYYGIRAITARLTNPYGMGQGLTKKQGVIPIFMRAVQEERQIEIWGDGSAVRDYVYIEDAVDALVRLAYYSGDYSLFNVASGERYSLLEIINILEKKTGKKAIIRFLPERKCDLHYNAVSSGRIRSECEWKPMTTLMEGIDWMLEK